MPQAGIVGTLSVYIGYTWTNSIEYYIFVPIIIEP